MKAVAAARGAAGAGSGGYLAPRRSRSSSAAAAAAGSNKSLSLPRATALRASSSTSQNLEQQQQQQQQQQQHTVQQIYDSLSAIPLNQLRRSVEHPAECPQVQTCLSHMDRLTLQDLGLSPDLLEQLATQQKRPLCMHVHEGIKFDLAVFLLPKGKSLPLHNHPGMCVLTKVVHGGLRVNAYNEVSTQQTEAPVSKRLRGQGFGATLLRSLSANRQNTGFAVTPAFLDVSKTPRDKAWFLSPSEGNLHDMLAEAHTVVFDVLMPPYDPPNRDCHYYSMDSQANNNAAATEVAAAVLTTTRLVECEGPSGPDAIGSAVYRGYVPKDNKNKTKE